MRGQTFTRVSNMFICSTDSIRCVLGTRFDTNLAGQDVYAYAQEFEPMTRIAWGGGPKGITEQRLNPAPRIGRLRNARNENEGRSDAPVDQVESDSAAVGVPH
jgi:hypothetical protein